jgi:hypothetical protein
MTQGLFEPIYPNPYIVGNPIRSRDMFFGRMDEFRFIARALEDGRKTAIIVLFGERRSGKSSILYQILNGELGAAFLPIFVDMQIMAGIANEAEFFSRIIADTCKTLRTKGLSPEHYASLSNADNPTEMFRRFLKDVEAHFPNRCILLLIDEYEILEAKIIEGCLSHNVLIFFAGLLESEQVSFVFTGSKRLEMRDEKLWGGELLQKAVSRKISFLTKDDTARLVTQPLANRVTFAPEVITQIYTLTAGQPFYTQLICQNLVYHLNEVKKYHVGSADLQTVVENILENPPPQMIFNWGEHSAERKLVLSLLAEFSGEPGVFLSAHEIRRGIAKNKLELVIGHAQLNSVLAELFQDEYVLQKDHKYGFRLDLFRRWIRHDHNIWQVKKEIGAEELTRITKPAEQQAVKRKRARIVVERGILVLAAIAAVYYGSLYFFSSQRKVMIKANGGPFDVEIDGVLAGTTSGQPDSTIFVSTALRKEEQYEIKVTHAISKESQRRQVEITEDNQEIRFAFREYPVTITSNAARVEGKFGGLAFPSASQPESWRYTFNVTAGNYPLMIQDSQNGFGPIDTILAVPLKTDTIRIDFADLVIITLKANLPFTYQFERDRLKKEKSKIAETWSEDSTLVVLRGCRKGFYKFTFTNPRTGEAISRDTSITSDGHINVNFSDTVIITLRANVPFVYKAVHEKSKKIFETRASASKSFVLNGCPKGWYQFTFTDPYPGQKIERKLSIQKNETININFPTPPTPRVRINTEPSGAEVILNGKLADSKTPYIEYHQKGWYAIKLIKAGYDTLDMLIFLNNDTTITKKFAQQSGYLMVTVNAKDGGAALPDAKIYVTKAGESQEQYLGEAGKLANQRAELQVGGYTLRVERDGFNDERREILIGKGKTERLQITLTKQ